MRPRSPENLKAIRFAGQLLPNWAQLLDLAAMLCPVSNEVRHWFVQLTTRAGVEDSRTVTDQCRLLRQSLQENREFISVELGHTRNDLPPTQVIRAWLYALDTMIQEAESSKTCSWTVEGADDDGLDDPGGGDISLRRV